jgi:hypothetical protein
MPHDALWHDLHRVDVWELLTLPTGDTVLRKRSLLGNFQLENQEWLREIANRLRKNYVAP